jgi:hypothetical protein
MHTLFLLEHVSGVERKVTVCVCVCVCVCVSCSFLCNTFVILYYSWGNFSSILI